MPRRNKPSGCPSRSRRGAPQGTAVPPEGGYALLVVMMVAMILLISLAAALPNIYTQGQREREEELIFRGNEYARAIMLFRRQFRRYPTSVKELLETNGIRFLRREYPDPMTRKGKWRFIHADASGTPIDSRTLSRPAPPSPLQSAGAASQTAAPKEGGTKEAAEPETGKEERSAFFGQGKQIQGAFIIGVASTSTRESIRVWNSRTRYSDWEFLGVEMNPAGTTPLPSGFQQSRPSGPGPQAPGFPMMPPLSDRPKPQQ